MTTREDLRTRLRTAGAWLEATPAELVGLLVLLLSGLGATGVLWWWSQAPGGHGQEGVPAAAAPAPGPPAPLLVHVAGAVASPDVVEVPAGSRVAEAVAAAGGALPEADLDQLNLARLLEDGERVVVPRRGEAAPTDPAGTEPGLVDLNRADVATLEGLPGIGPVLAGRIVRWREQHGPFRQAGELREVPGIGERTFQGLVDLVTVG